MCKTVFQTLRICIFKFLVIYVTNNVYVEVSGQIVDSFISFHHKASGGDNGSLIL